MGMTYADLLKSFEKFGGPNQFVEGLIEYGREPERAECETSKKRTKEKKKKKLRSVFPITAMTAGTSLAHFRQSLQAASNICAVSAASSIGRILS